MNCLYVQGTYVQEPGIIGGGRPLSGVQQKAANRIQPFERFTPSN